MRRSSSSMTRVWRMMPLVFSCAAMTIDHLQPSVFQFSIIKIIGNAACMGKLCPCLRRAEGGGKGAFLPPGIPRTGRAAIGLHCEYAPSLWLLCSGGSISGTESRLILHSNYSIPQIRGLSQEIHPKPRGLQLLFYWKPKLRSWLCRLRQPSRTFTQHWRLTWTPKKPSISSRASEAIFFSIAPPFPMTMPLWLSFSQ